MQAIVFEKYGSPDVLELKEVENPVPMQDQVLLQVCAASANPLDWHRMRGAPFIARLDGGFLKPKDTRLGADVAGRVQAVGKNVTQFKPGDEVFGSIGAGSFAQYAATKATDLALKPANLSFEQAAAMPVVGYTALQGLRDFGKIQAGQKVLVNGASGGVGTFAVQLAKSYGTHVTGVCSSRNLDLVRSLGADAVVDYTKTDFTNNGKQYDLIYDAVGNRSVADFKRALNAQGICVVAGFTTLSRLFEHVALGGWESRKGNQKIGLMSMAKTDQTDLQFIAQLLESRRVVPVIDRCYPFRETPEAIRYLEQGHARGKVVITIQQL